MEERNYNVWIVAQPSKQVDGEWVAHCLDFDIVSQGKSFEHAITMVLEATSMVVFEDLVVGHDPSDRRAPESYFQSLSKVISNGTKVPLKDALAKPKSGCVYAVTFHLKVERVAVAAPDTVRTPTKTKKPKMEKRPRPVAEVAFAQQVAC